MFGDWVRTGLDKLNEYLAAIEAAGGLKAYEKAHAKALAATLAKKFPAHIPEEIFPRVVAFWAHAGFYASALGAGGRRCDGWVGSMAPAAQAGA